MTETVSSGAPSHKGKRKGSGLKMRRIHNTGGVHPYDQVTRERRAARTARWREVLALVILAPKGSAVRMGGTTALLVAARIKSQVR